MPLETSPFDIAEYLDTEEDIEEFMKAAFEEGNSAFIARCLGIVARAQRTNLRRRRLIQPNSRQNVVNDTKNCREP